MATCLGLGQYVMIDQYDIPQRIKKENEKWKKKSSYDSIARHRRQVTLPTAVIAIVDSFTRSMKRIGNEIPLEFGLSSSSSSPSDLSSL